MGGVRSTRGREENALILRFESPKGRDLSEDQGVDGRIILECVLCKESGKVWTRYIWLRIGIGGGLL
jgi:hypothetical protein